MTSPWVDGESLDASDMHARTTAVTDGLQIQLNNLGLLAIDSGSTSITPSGINTTTSLAVNFTAGRFPSAPKVMVQLLTGPSGTGTVFLWVTGVTNTGFTLNINRSTTTATSVYWMAVLTA